MLTPVVSGLTLPVYVTASPGDDARLFVLERQGTIRVVRDGVLLAHPFLDLRAIVAAAGSDEQGLLGLAFHPRYQENRRFLVMYSLVTNDGDEAPTVLAEFVRSEADWDLAELASERRLLVSRQVSPIHHGGMLAFHPLDGLLYVSQGDSGSGTGQDLSTWDGKMLRIDVDGATEDLAYGIPAGNLSGPGVAPEIWSLGLRNPWRFSFDACTADLYIGDVGEADSEEIDFEPANTPSRNYGWDIREGTLCFEESSECSRTDLVPPITEYEHGFGCAVIGGYVYRGERIPALRGTYLFSDYCNDGFFSLRVENGQLAVETDMTFDLNPARENLAITSFGVDNAGELYVVNRLGVLYRVDPE
jgi:glucose/arabinose dehydrogenase